ncbi:VMAP-C domain-containing protein [Amycolatopsis sp. NPDC003861]
MAASTPASLRAIYREATQSVPGLARLPENPDDVMLSVEALRVAVNPQPLFECLTRLAAGFTEFVHSRLWDWIRTTAPNYGVELTDLENLDDELRRTYFVVRMEPDLLGSGFQVTVWRFTGAAGSQVMTTDEPRSLEHIAEMLSGLVDEFGGDPDATLPIVEFFLPLELLDHALEALPIRFEGVEREVGTVCPVVVRPLDRISQSAWHQAWQDCWEGLDARCHSYDPAAIFWAERPGTGLPEKADPAGHVCLALAYDLPAGPHEDGIFQSVLSSGVPVVLWHRTRTGRWNRRQALEQILNAWALKALPDRVHRQRVAARAAGIDMDHAGHDLVLMWDDPTRVPHGLEWLPPFPKGAVS